MEHPALDGKAFRYDDPFRDTCCSKNGWNRKCFVTTENEYEAKNNGREVCSSGGDGEEPDIPGVNEILQEPEKIFREITPAHPG
jgi:uncharacterized protein with gpF-like domain